VRVVAGTAKGTRLARAPEGVRPLSARAREGLFSSLGEVVAGARVLDLYAGTGALGVEALSRGAERATFVDRAPESLRVVRENLDRTGLAGGGRVVRSEALRFVTRTDKNVELYELVFLDPPYSEEASDLERVLVGLTVGRLASPDWAAVLTRGRKSSMPVIPLDWRVARCLEYGDTLVFVYREA